MSFRSDIMDLLAAAVTAQAGSTIPTVKRIARSPDTGLITLAETPAVFIQEPRESFEYQPALQSMVLLHPTVYLIAVEWDEEAAGMARLDALVDTVKLALHKKVRELDTVGSGLIVNLDILSIEQPTALYPLYVFPFRLALTHYGGIETT